MNIGLFSRSLKVLFFFFIVGGCALPSMAWAQTSDTGTLSDEERYQANLRRWQSMTEEERQAIRSKAAALSEEDRGVLQEKVKEYRAMPEPERKALHENFQRFRELPPERREVLEEGDREFRQLPPERRDEIRRGFKEKRRGPDGQGRGPRESERMDGSDVRPQGGPDSNGDNSQRPHGGSGDRPRRDRQRNSDDNPSRPQGEPGENSDNPPQGPRRAGPPDREPGPARE